MTEFALVVPIFLFLLLGIVELSLLFMTRASYQEGALQAVRVAAAAGQNADADQQALKQLQNTLGPTDLRAISSVTIYDATVSGSFAVPISNTAPYDNAHTTYVYSPTVGTFVCAVSGALPPTPCTGQSYWSPFPLRNVTGGSLDYVGVAIAYTYKGATGVLPTFVFTQSDSTMIEPSAYGP